MEAGRVSEAEAAAAIDEVLALRSALAKAIGVMDAREAMTRLRTGQVELSDEAREVFEKFNRAIVLLQL